MYFIDSFGCLCYGNRTKYSKGDSRENGNPTVMRKNTTQPISFTDEDDKNSKYKVIVFVHIIATETVNINTFKTFLF